MSAEKYIKTRARTLPVYKCLVNEDWELSMVADVIIMRKHVNGNITAGLYLVDLYCLGIKDTFFFFNEDEGSLMEKFEAGSFTEIDYNLAHNIVYAGHDYAAEFDIQPHKLFSTTKFLLEEDDDNIPMIDIHTGDEDGNPCLMVDRSYNYLPVLAKLRKHAGEGNYEFAIVDEPFDDGVDSEEEDDKEFEEESPFADIDYDFLDFPDVRDVDEEVLEDAADDHTRSMGDGHIIHAESMMRLLYERKPGYKKTYDEIIGSKEFQDFENNSELHEEELDRSQPVIEAISKELNAIADRKEKDFEILTKLHYSLFQKYAGNEMGGSIILNAMTLVTLALNIEKLKEHLSDYPPLTQLTVIAYSLSIQSELKKQEEKFLFAINASSPAEAFPGEKIHSMHYKIFWVVQSLAAMMNKDESRMAHYHSLLTVSGIGGNLKHAYAIYLGRWLEKNN